MTACIVCGQPSVDGVRCEAHLQTYVPAGPTIEQFHNCTKFVKGIMGSFGSSKSVACCFDILFNAMKQHKQKDGKRRARYAVTRSTYRELEDSTIRTWMDWMGPFGNYTKTSNSFMLTYNDIEAEVLFRALDKPEDVEKLLSTEYTKAWMNEARDIPAAIFQGLSGRVGRYPPKRDGGPVEPGIIIDTNPPDEDELNWLYKLFEITMYKDPQMMEEYQWFKQPPGAVFVDGRWEDNWGQVKGIPKAENIENLPEGYYRKMCIGKDREWIKVYAEGKYGFVQDGRPVYSQYNDDIHSYDGVEADPSLPLYLGWDAGLTPACVIGQISKRGQLRVLHELNAREMGVYQFARDAVATLIKEEYAGYSVAGSWGDPAQTRGDAAMQSAIGVLNDIYVAESDNDDGMTQAALNMGFDTIPAPGGNTLAPRLDAVNQYLTRLIDGAPAFLMHPRCAMLRKGFLGRYRYERVQVSGRDERYKDLPKKNAYSHGHDALQNLCKGLMGETNLEDDDFDYYDIPMSGNSAWSGR